MCIPEDRAVPGRRQHGLSMIELVLFIVIISIAVVALLQLMTNNTRISADPQRRKQALAVAEALLEEVRLMPFTDCEPDAFDAATGTCGRPEAMGPEGAFSSAQGNQSVAETRGSATAPFDNVNDYDGFTLNGGGADLGNSGGVLVPAGYSASVRITPENAFGAAGAALPASAVLRIAVTVRYGEGSVVLEGYRTKYAPTVTP